MYIDAEISTQKKPTIMIVGGYGVVGQQIAQLLTRRVAGARLIIAGRSFEKAKNFAATLPNAIGAEVNVYDNAPIAGISDPIDVIISAVNDPHNNILTAAIEHEIGYVDVTRWTEALESAVIVATSMQTRTPILFSSGWMAGIPALVARELSENLSSVESVEMSILFTLADKAGPDSISFAAQMGVPALTFVNGRWIPRPQMRDKKLVTFGDGMKAYVRSFSTPDLRTLPGPSKSKTVKVNIGYDDALSSNILAFMVKSGIWKAMSGPAFSGLRKAILYHPGEGAPHRVQVEVSGRDAIGGGLTLVGQVIDPKGQTHLTALGATLAAERILGLHPTNLVQSGVQFSDGAPDPGALLRHVRAEGVLAN